jgi:hypothetical protein
MLKVNVTGDTGTGPAVPVNLLTFFDIGTVSLAVTSILKIWAMQTPIFYIFQFAHYR